MARSDEAENFFAAVYQAVQEIPEAKVTSYGHIAMLIGRRGPRLSYIRRRAVIGQLADL